MASFGSTITAVGVDATAQFLASSKRSCRARCATRLGLGGRVPATDVLAYTPHEMDGLTELSQEENGQSTDSDHFAGAQTELTTPPPASEMLPH